LLLDEIAKDILALRSAIVQMLNYETHLKGYNELVGEKAIISQIHLSSFLSAGAKVIDAGYARDTECPFCLSPHDLRKLRSEIAERLKAITHVNTRLETASASVQELIATFMDAKALCAKIYDRYDKQGIPRSSP